MKKALTLSLVIPVFNEEYHIKKCLDAVAAQTVLPDEVIVVDNNCTDATIAIVKKYRFVRIVSEKRQGRGWARTKGFNESTSDIIGRIDADSQLMPKWTEQALKSFSDKTVDGITGVAEAALLPRLRRPRSTLWSRAYYWLVHPHFRTITMWGSTMAVRRSRWQQVANKVCNDDRLVHEDQDLSLWLAAEGAKLIVNPKLKIRTDVQSFMYLPKFWYYTMLRNRTYQLHKQNGNLAKVVFRLSFWRTLPGAAAAVILGIPFFLASLIFLPLDLLMIKLGQSRFWLGSEIN